MFFNGFICISNGLRSFQQFWRLSIPPLLSLITSWNNREVTHAIATVFLHLLVTHSGPVRLYPFSKPFSSTCSVSNRVRRLDVESDNATFQKRIQQSMRSSPEPAIYNSRPQRPQSFWSVPRIDTSGKLQHRKSVINGFFVNSGKSDWLRPLGTGNAINSVFVASSISKSSVLLVHTLPLREHQSRFTFRIVSLWRAFSKSCVLDAVFIMDGSLTPPPPPKKKKKRKRKMVPYWTKTDTCGRGLRYSLVRVLRVGESARPFPLSSPLWWLSKTDCAGRSSFSLVDWHLAVVRGLVYLSDPLSYAGGRQLPAGLTIPDRSREGGQTKYSPIQNISCSWGLGGEMIYDHGGKLVNTVAWANHPLSR